MRISKNTSRSVTIVVKNAKERQVLFSLLNCACVIDGIEKLTGSSVLFHEQLRDPNKDMHKFCSALTDAIAEDPAMKDRFKG